jgi:ribosomal protein S18 acetylase RimI-like enzyme
MMPHEKPSTAPADTAGIAIIAPNGRDHDIFAQIAALHRAEIPDGFLPTLGARFLTALYSSIAMAPDAFIRVAVSGGAVRGFICAATSTPRVYRHVLRSRGLALAVAAAPRALSPGVLRRVWETLRYPGDPKLSDLPDAEILNFCVSEKDQRRGTGRALFTALVQEFSARKTSRIRIVTGRNQRSAQSFYLKAGATLRAETEIHVGTKSLIYEFEIPHANSQKVQ